MLLLLAGIDASAQPLVATLDHATIAVRDHGACMKTLTDLGFRLSPPQKRTTGTENSFATVRDGTYLELNAVIVPQADRGKAYAEFLTRREGVMQVGLKVKSIEQTVRQLRAAGLAASDANTRTVQLVGEKAPPEPAFWTARVAPASDSLPVFFIQYRLDTWSSGSTDQDNTVTGIHEVILVVRDLAAGIRHYAAFAVVGSQDLEFPDIAAKGRAVTLDGGGVIRLVTAKSSNGAAAKFLRDQGEGVMGLGFHLDNRAALVSRLREKNIPFERIAESLVVEPRNACGVRLEFY